MRDQTGIPQTCPFIDKIQNFLAEIEWDEDEKYLANECLKASAELEIIRKHNSGLRDFGNKQYEELIEVEKEKKSMQDYINQLESEIAELKKQIEDLEGVSE